MKRVSPLWLFFLLACMWPSCAEPTVTEEKPAPAVVVGTGEEGDTGEETGTGEEKPVPAVVGGAEAEDCADERPSEFLALVNGVGITGEQVDALFEEDLLELGERLRQARERELYLEINSHLLEAEARREKTSATELLEKLFSGVEAPTEAEAREFYSANRQLFHGEFPDLKDRLVLHLRRQRASEKAKELADRLRAAAEIELLAGDLGDLDLHSDPRTALARVNGETISLGAVDARLGALSYQIEERIHEIRRNAIVLLVNTALVDDIAQKKGMSSEAFLEAVVEPKPGEVSELEIRQFYDRNRDRLDVDYRDPEGRAKIVDLLRQSETQKRKASLIELLRREATIEVFLEAPVLPASMLRTEDQPTKGPADAAVTIVEFIDFQCPRCGELQELLAELLEEYAGELRVVARDLPLERHERAQRAAVAAEAARDQGKYWEYATILFENQGALAESDLVAYARRLGLDGERFAEALEAEEVARRVQRDRRDALELGIRSTPTVFVNGRRIGEKSRESLVQAIEASLQASTNKK